MELERVSSSLIHSVGYDSEGQELHVVFKKPQRHYVYTDFPPDLYQEFRNSESLGRFFLGTIKGQFEHRVEPS